jgi:zinc/manganese transport system permease protein
MYELLIAPFVEFAFMQRALAGGLIVALAAAPIGVFLVLRRMSLTGDALAHGVLPGVAAGFLFAGLSIPVMTFGGFIAGLAVALAAGFIARATRQREDSSLAALYLIALAAGVTLLSLRADQVDLTHILFGSALGLTDDGLIYAAGAAILVAFGLALIWPALVLDSFDPSFLRADGGAGGLAHAVFLALVVAVLLAGFQALGTLMSVGLMVLPAAAARLCVDRLRPMIATAWVFAVLSVLCGLVVSYHSGAPSGPAIILAAGCCYIAALLFGPADGWIARRAPRSHYAG